ANDVVRRNIESDGVQLVAGIERKGFDRYSGDAVDGEHQLGCKILRLRVRVGLETCRHPRLHAKGATDPAPGDKNLSCHLGNGLLIERPRLEYAAPGKDLSHIRQQADVSVGKVAIR